MVKITNGVHVYSQVPSIKSHLEAIRADGLVPIINSEQSTDETIEVEAICLHGRSLWAVELSLNEARGYDWDCEVERDGCGVCDELADGRYLICPKCSAGFPAPSEQIRIEAYLRNEDLTCTTSCPKCGSPWLTWCGDGLPPPERPQTFGPEECGKWSLTYACGCHEDHRSGHSTGSTDPNAPKVGRNEPCPCGSGKKYKKCHGS